MAAGKVTLNLVKERETKGTVVYQEEMEGDTRGHTFYLLKSEASKISTPDRITLTVEAAK